MKLPDFKRLVFVQNETRPEIFDLRGSNFTKFTFFRLSEPRSPFLLKQGARYVIESWQNHEKSLFTGLIPVYNGFYYGDNISPQTGKKSLIIANFRFKEITLFYFNDFTVYPSLRVNFIKDFLSRIVANGNQYQNLIHLQ